MRGYEPVMPQRKQRRKPDAGLVVLIVCVVGLVLSLALLLWIKVSEPVGELPDEAPVPPVSAKIKHDSLAPTYTYDGEIIRWYVFQDPDSGVQYLVNDRGGCAPRIGKNGHVIGVQDEAA